MSAPLPISSCVIEDWFHGLYTALLFITLWMIAFREKLSSREKVKTLLWVIPPYICSTIHAALNWVYYSQAIDNNELPGGSGLLFSLTHLQPWLEGTGDAFFCLNILLADCFFVWRCWMIWGRKWPIIMLPILATISGAVLGGMSSVDQVLALETQEAFTAAKHSARFITLSTAYFSLSLATSLMVTILILIRIVLAQRMSNASGTKLISRTTELFLESALLYSISLSIFLAFDVTKNPNEFYAINVHAQMTGIAPLLINLRIVAGQSRPQDTWQRKDLIGNISSIITRSSETKASPTLRSSTTRDRSDVNVATKISTELMV